MELDRNKLKIDYSLGYESVIFLYDNLLLKYFRDEFIEDHINKIFDKTHDLDWFDMVRGKTISENELKNKENKLDIIKNLECLKDEIKIYDKVYENGIFKGYTMEKCKYKRISSNDRLKHKVKYLQLIKEKLINLNENGVFIGDFNAKNFFISPNNSIKMCDLDNLRIFDYDFDTKNNSVKRFEFRCNKKEYIDSYCFNIFTMRYLTIPLSDFELMTNKLPYILNTKANKEIIDSMINLDDTYEKKYLIDNLR